MKTAGDDQGYERVFAEAMFKPFLAKVRVKQEMVNDEMRVKNSMLKVEDLDFIDESKNLIDAINKYN
jgi:replication factor A1